MKRMVGAFVNESQEDIDFVYTEENKKRLAELCDFLPGFFSREDIRAGKAEAVDVLFSTWGMPSLTEDEIGKMPNLKALFYSAGATDAFARPFLAKHIPVTCACRVNAIPVADHCHAEILLALKGFYRVTKAIRSKEDWGPSRNLIGPGAYGETVALIGSGLVSTLLQERLKPHDLKVIVVSTLPENRTVSIADAFRQAYVISNHLPDRSDNIKTIGRAEFESMRPGAVFINTGRGAQIDEEALADVFSRRPDLTAILDVTEPEPPEDDSPLYKLPNVWLTSHIAGSYNDELHRMTDCMIQEFERFLNGQPLQYQVAESMLLISK